MDNNLQPIQIKIVTSGAEEAVKSIRSVTEALKELKAVSGQVTGIMKDFGNVKIGKYIDFGNSSEAQYIDKINNSHKKYNKTIKTSNNSLTSLNTNFKKLYKNTLGLVTSFITMRSATKYLSEAFDESASWVENLNVMEVAFDDMSGSAQRFVKSVSSGLGLDPNQLLEYVSLFQQMASAMGQTTNTAYMMSTALTLLGTDVASLYNKDVKVTMEALRSAIAGQVKPVRQFGFDITSYSIDGLIEQMGILEGYTSRMMTQSQKQLARTILLIQQSKNAWGDLGKTLETYSNQQKILSAQFTNLKRAIGDLFVGTKDDAGIATELLYYINGLLMSIVQVIRYLIPEATSSGFNEVNKDLENMEENVKNLEESLNGALTSFDKFNTLSQSTSTGNAGITALLEQKLADEYQLYLKEWEKRMEKISTRAHEIRDTILEWLGFQKKINTYTETIGKGEDAVQIELSEVTFELKEGLTVVSKIKDILKEISSYFKEIYTSTKPIFEELLNDEEFGNSLKEIGRELLDLFKELAGIIKVIMPPLTSGLVKVIKFITPFIEQISKALNDIVKELEVIFSDSLTQSNFKEFMESLGYLVNQILPPIIDFAKNILPNLAQTLVHIFNIVGPALSAILKLLGAILKPLMQIIDFGANISLGWLNDLLNLISYLVKGLEILISLISQGLSEAFNDLFKNIEFHFRGKASQRFGMFANGGYPDTGSMFIANERGPELVGNIGGRTAVANNDMIVKAIENASFRGMTMALASNGGNDVARIKIDANADDLSRALAKSMSLELHRQGKI